ncbi:efflux RND transporter periplasmic adaptor subunit [Pseudobutyrivibrio ruminis]|uniref:efflux RND transporter periplasmic adaptor subunit n=1 Tax=Pseudobutyrivibrio ruminis TaxID=46206 RepID=UPI00051C502E|nr:efflux RND transporter periplasmic adaptor subunit [Pseudobutyrivibrio ruminis]
MKLKEILNKLNFTNKLYEEEFLDEEIDESLDEEMSAKDRTFFKKMNKKVVACMIIAALVISSVAGVAGFKYVKAKGQDSESEPITIEATKQNIEKTLSATGTIISAEESGQFATTTSSYPVEEVYVKVGDVVKKGDPLYKLDMTTMEQTLSYQQQALNIQNQQNEISQQNANQALADAQRNGANQINDSNRNLESAKQDQNTANRNKQNANNSLTAASNSENDAKKEMDAASATLSSAQQKVDNLNSKITDLQNQINNPGTEQVQKTDENGQLMVDAEGNPVYETKTKDTADLQNQLSQAKTDLETAKTELSNAQSDFESKHTAYKNAVAATESAKQSVQSAGDSVSSANRSVESAQSSLNNTTDSANSNVYTQSQAIKSNELSSKSNTLSAQQEIEKSQEELSKATVYASQDGTVTNVNIVKGQTYSGTDAVVIDNVTSLKATADIDEAQIPSVQVGQKVQIKTDATGDEVLNGTVVFVSPTATKNSTKTTDATSTTASVSKSRATYRVDVQIEDANENLRLGMTAKMTFITASSENAIAVPSSDIKTSDDGSKYVVIQTKDGSTKNVTVTTGISDDFYTEITGGDLKEGEMIVESDIDENSADATLESMGTDGGIYFE